MEMEKMDDDQEQFGKANPEYGYGDRLGLFAQLREDFTYLHHDSDEGDTITYLDHAGATLHAKSQIQRCQQHLMQYVFANPHSKGPASMRTADMIDSVRESILAFCGTTSRHYAVVFTAGATSAIKLVGESFRWHMDSQFVYMLDNHTSVVGMREYAKKNTKMGFTVVDSTTLQPVYSFSREENKKDKEKENENGPGKIPCLFAYPAESNFCGTKYSPDLIDACHRGTLPFQKRQEQEQKTNEQEWFVLLDAAKACATQPPNLSKHAPDFVSMSFYKIFGYPSGLGCLLVRRGRPEQVLLKKYFGGGTVAAIAAPSDFCSYRSDISAKFEDGTVAFSSIPLLAYGFTIMKTLGMDAIQRHTESLRLHLHKILAGLKHFNGNPVCELYSRWLPSAETETGDAVRSGVVVGTGPVVTFNLLAWNGDYVGYAEVEKLASSCSIQLRSGCFCNAGACGDYLGLTPDDIERNLRAGHVCWDEHDIMDGKPTGAVRISLGYMTSLADIQTFIDFIIKYFVDQDNKDQEEEDDERKHTLAQPESDDTKKEIHAVLARALIYPIKSCKGQKIVDTWPVGPHGLLYDREWVIVTPNGTALNQKRVPKMCLINAHLDLKRNLLTLSAPSMDPLYIAVEEETEQQQERERIKLVTDELASSPVETPNTSPSSLSVCGARCQGLTYGPSCEKWLSAFLERPCNLARNVVTRSFQRVWEGSLSPKSHIAFANEAPYLLISTDSVRAFIESNKDAKDMFGEINEQIIQDAVTRFRPNLVIQGAAPFSEDDCAQVVIHPQLTLQSVGPCVRCGMVDIDQKTANRNVKLLKALASDRRKDGKIVFGMLLRDPLQTPSASSSSEKQSVERERRDIVIGTQVTLVRTKGKVQ